MAQWSDFIGTVKGYICLGVAGVRLKNSSSTLYVRNAGDTADAPINTSAITGLTTALSVGQGGTGLSVAGTSGNVLTSNGTVWVSSTPSGGVGAFPFYIAAGTLDSISLISGSALPFFVASGAQDNINLVV